MSPIRILILGLLFYVFYRLLFGGAKKEAETGREEGQAENLPAHDVLVKDPVCQVYVPKGQALVARDGDEPVYFCSEKCREIFLANQGEHR